MKLIKSGFSARPFVISIIAAVFMTVQPQDAQALNTIKVLLVKFCDSNGFNCSTANEAGLQDQLDITNEIYRRSNLPFEYVIHPGTSFGIGSLRCMDTDGDGVIDEQDDPCNWDDVASTKCEQGDLTGDFDSDGISNQTDHDANGNGTDGDDSDKNIICTPVAGHMDRLHLYATAFQQRYPDSFVMFSPGDAKEVKWKPDTLDTDKGKWEIEPKGGAGSCGWKFIYMPEGGGTGTLFAHEGGHHFCLPHPQAEDKNPANIVEAATMIRNYVNANHLDPYDTAAAIQVFDGDLTAWPFDADGDGDEDTLSILDTPPDPRGRIIAAQNLDENDENGDKCGPVGSVDVPVIYDRDINNDGYVNTLDIVIYELRPNRNLVMSYFKDCSEFDMIYSADEAEVISTVLFGHPFRKNLVEAQFLGTVWVGFKNNSGDERGTYYHPFNTISEAADHVAEGNEILIKRGSSNETPILSKEMTIGAYGGVVTVGES